jgi:hypothetical protein
LSGIPPTSIASRALNENLPPTLNSENRIWTLTQLLDLKKKKISPSIPYTSKNRK